MFKMSAFIWHTQLETSPFVGFVDNALLHSCSTRLNQPMLQLVHVLDWWLEYTRVLIETWTGMEHRIINSKAVDKWFCSDCIFSSFWIKSSRPVKIVYQCQAQKILVPGDWNDFIFGECYLIICRPGWRLFTFKRTKHLLFVEKKFNVLSEFWLWNLGTKWTIIIRVANHPVFPGTSSCISAFICRVPAKAFAKSKIAYPVF